MPLLIQFQLWQSDREWPKSMSKSWRESRAATRPPGRRMYTCAHELGHHVFGHGTRLDEYLAEGAKPSQRSHSEEQQANGFAAGLLMPSTAVQHAFHLREWSPTNCTPHQAFAISNWFGVSYTGFLDHLSLTLGLISKDIADRLKRHTPKNYAPTLFQV